jgi:two-component system NtrC family response regulator
MGSNILIVDDELNMCKSLEILLSEEKGWKVSFALTSQEALDLFDQKGPFEVVLTDLTMPEKDGIELLHEIKKRSEDTQVIIMTAYSTVKSAIAAMKAGAYEYLIKPFENEELVLIIEKALRLANLTRENRALKTELAYQQINSKLIGRSKAMQKVFFLIEKASKSDASVLITGESGTGKELIARAIHSLGKRSLYPFVTVNCAALPETLLESELFGHEKGAFTGAIKTKPGKFELAHKGTIFLDEIGDMSPAIQTKLLRVLQEYTFERVGGIRPIKVDIRIIAATNRNLETMLLKETFRKDLYYRLNVIPIYAPALREHPEDIPLLLEYFLNQKAAQAGCKPLKLSPKAKEILCRYHYPGNVRELENIIERLTVLRISDQITPEDLNMIQDKSPKLTSLNFEIPIENGWNFVQKTEKELERTLIQQAIEKYGDKSNNEIAKIIGTSRRILELRLQEFGIQKTKK